MTDIYTGGTRSGKRMTKSAWKAYLRKLKRSYKTGEEIKKKMEKQHVREKKEAENDLKHDLELI